MCVCLCVCVRVCVGAEKSRHLSSGIWTSGSPGLPLPSPNAESAICLPGMTGMVSKKVATRDSYLWGLP